LEGERREGDRREEKERGVSSGKEKEKI